jgi:glycerophosphoryl diester phosphodiesterase
VRWVDAQRESAALARGSPAPAAVGIYPEIKHPSYFASLGLAMERPLVEALHHWGYRDADAPVFIQSFETGNLESLRTMTRLRLIQLLNDTGQPFDFTLAGDARTYRDLATAQGLSRIAQYANGIGPNKNLILPRTAQGELGPATALVQDAHASGLLVHAWTFRAENAFLPRSQQSGAPGERGDLTGELQQFLQADIDGMFCDQADLALGARESFVRMRM